MFPNSSIGAMPTFKIVLGFSLCTLGGAMLYAYFKTRDDDDSVAADEKSNAQHRKQKPEKEICVKLVVSNEHIPLIVGRGGANLQLIEEKTCTKIRLRDKDSGHKFCDINGLPGGVKEARAMLLKEIERAPIVKDEMNVPQGVAQKITGRCGETLQEICRNSLAKVTVEPVGANGKAKIIIIGNQKQVNIARKLIEDKIDEDEELRRAVEEVEQKREPRRSPTNSLSSSMYSSQTSLSSYLPPREKLLAAKIDDKPMEVYVSAVASPTKFWVQLIGPQSKKLDDMVKEMTDYYELAENRGKHALEEPYVGQIVAAIFKYDNKWYRAEIVSIMPNRYNPNDIVIDLYFVDYGDSEYVTPADICELRTDFLTLRFQAVECFLANIKSTIANEPDNWQNVSTQKFEEITEVANWKKMIARVVTYKERSKPTQGVTVSTAAREGTPIPGVELFDPTEGVEVNIGHMLISHGFALPIDSDSPRSRSYTPTNSSETTIEEINARSVTPTSPESPTPPHCNLNDSLKSDNNANNNTFGVMQDDIDAEVKLFKQQLKHLSKKKDNSYLLNNGGGVSVGNDNFNHAKLTPEFLNGNLRSTGAAAAANGEHNLNGNLSR